MFWELRRFSLVFVILLLAVIPYCPKTGNNFLSSKWQGAEQNIEDAFCLLFNNLFIIFPLYCRWNSMCFSKISTGTHLPGRRWHIVQISYSLCLIIVCTHRFELAMDQEEGSNFWTCAAMNWAWAKKKKKRSLRPILISDLGPFMTYCGTWISGLINKPAKSDHVFLVLPINMI